MKPGAVVWKPPARVAHPALAVPCGTCGAVIGKHCTTSYSAGDPREPHPMRRMIAEAHGFSWAPGARPASEAAYLAALHSQPEAAADPQPTLF